MDKPCRPIRYGLAKYKNCEMFTNLKFPTSRVRLWYIKAEIRLMKRQYLPNRSWTKLFLEHNHADHKS
jgi:hypothetical protein